MGSLMVAAQLGLEPGSAMGHCYLIPFKGKVQFILGYRGMIELARRSGQIVSINAHAVYENDTFSYELGIDEMVVHKPQLNGDRGQLVAVYAIAKLVGGGYQLGVMSKTDVENIRLKSNNPTSTPWRDHYDEMAKKTVIRRLYKYLPISVEMARSNELEHAIETDKFDASRVLEGELEDGLIFDEETGEIESPMPPPQSQADQLAASIA